MGPCCIRDRPKVRRETHHVPINPALQPNPFASPKETIERRDAAALLQRARPRQISKLCSSHFAPLALMKET